MYKFVFFVPETHKEAVKQAVFAAGAGRLGCYDSCSWEVAGTGQFRPLAGATPFLGNQGDLETVVEYRVEMVCAQDHMKAALAALLEAHPYEEPAYDIVSLIDVARL